jgi:hypothetical protein
LGHFPHELWEKQQQQGKILLIGPYVDAWCIKAPELKKLSESGKLTCEQEPTLHT